MKDSQPTPGLGAIPVGGRLFCYLGAKAIRRVKGQNAEGISGRDFCLIP
jgi:hypothetical protein